MGVIMTIVRGMGMLLARLVNVTFPSMPFWCLQLANHLVLELLLALGDAHPRQRTLQLLFRDVIAIELHEHCSGCTCVGLYDARLRTQEIGNGPCPSFVTDTVNLPKYMTESRGDFRASGLHDLADPSQRLDQGVIVDTLLAWLVTITLA